MPSLLSVLSTTLYHIVVTRTFLSGEVTDLLKHVYYLPLIEKLGSICSECFSVEKRGKREINDSVLAQFACNISETGLFWVQALNFKPKK